MIAWRGDLEEMPKDGRWVFIINEYDQPAVVYWSEGFGWTYDGGDHFNPIAWAECLSPTGAHIYP